jgi:hypothetical protein
VSLSLIACIGLLGLVVSGRRRAWWLVGLAPVLALFAHRFALGPEAGSMTAVENPTFVAAADGAGFIRDGDYVVGLAFGDGVYAYPYAQLYSTPIVIQADHEKRLMLLWSAFANRALAVAIGRELHARDLEIVSTPANALLVYNTRLGQFINGFTGRTTKAEKPAGFGSQIVTVKMPWGQWRRLHPDVRVMAPQQTKARFALGGPGQPIQPTCPMPPMMLEHPADLPIVLVGTTQPTAIEPDGIGPAPLNLRADDQPILVFRENSGQPIRAFSRQVRPDLLPRFVRNTNPRKHPNAAFIDVDTDSGWDANGVCVDGLKELKGKRLERVPIDEGVYLGVVKFWYPEAHLESPAAQPPETWQEPTEEPTTVPTHRRSRRPRPRRQGAPQSSKH